MTHCHTPTRTLSRALTIACCSALLWSVASSAQLVQWYPIGPQPATGGQTYGCNTCRVDVSGRASVLAVNPMNPDEVWLGTAAGGVWRSTTAGTTWAPQSDREASLAIGAIALEGCDAGGCSTIYAGTGENNLRRDTYYGAGLLIGEPASSYSPTWTLSGHDLFNLGSIHNVVLDPATSGASKRLYVTLSSGVTASATESTVTAPQPPMGYGIYRSEDRGATWSKLDVAGSNGARPTDLEMDPQNSDLLFAGFLGRGVFRGTRNPADGTIQWCPLHPGVPLPAGCAAATGLPDPTTTEFDHVEISVHHSSPAQAATLYAVLGNCPNPIRTSCNPEIYRSVDGGNTWTQSLSHGPASYSRYTHVLTIHPANPSTVLFGGLKLHRSTDGAQTFTAIGSDTLHPDHQAVVFADPLGCASNASQCDRLYNASDGGFAYSSDGGLTWESGNSLQITGFQSITTSPLTDRIIGGSQDNGTNMWLGTNIWEHRNDGDSASTIMDRNHAQVMYDVYLEEAPRRSKNSGACCGWPWIDDGIDKSDASAFYPPFVQDPTPSKGAPDPSLFPPYHRLYFGTNRLYRSQVPPGEDTLSWRPGDSWAPVSPVLGGTGVLFPDILQTNVITAIAVAPNDPNRVYVGYYDGQLFRSNAAGPCVQGSCWTSLTKAPLPAAPVTRIAVHPTNAQTAYVTFSGFQLPGCAHVFKTENGGSTWSAASGPSPCDPNHPDSLPDIPANTVSLQPSLPDTPWVGTDRGVYVSGDGGATWVDFNGVGNKKLPNVPVYEIAIDETRGRVIAGTHGRGAWLHSLDGGPLIDIYEVACKPPCGLDIFMVGNSVINPAGDVVEVQLILADGEVFAQGHVDAQGATIHVGPEGQLVTSRRGLYENRVGAWAGFHGTGIGGAKLGALDDPDNPLAAVAIRSGPRKAFKQLLGAPAVSDPPSSTLQLSSLEVGAGTLAGVARSFMLSATLQGDDGSTRALCQVRVPIQAGADARRVLLGARDALNRDRRCSDAGLTAEVRGLLRPTKQRLEDEPLKDRPRLELSAPRTKGVQLIPSVRVPAGRATGVWFDLDGLGVPVRNTLMPMALRFETATRGARGGELTLVERSMLGTCAVNVSIARRSSARQIAAAVAEAFQARKRAAPRGSCPAAANPRDIVLNGESVTTVLASELAVRTTDPGVGFTLQPLDPRRR